MRNVAVEFWLETRKETSLTVCCCAVSPPWVRSSLCSARHLVDYLVSTQQY